MSSDFRLGTLEQLIDFRNGKTTKKADGDIPIYGGNGVLGYSDKSNYESTLVIGRVGAYCGSVHIEKGKCWVSDNAIAGLPKNGYNNEYNYYLLKSLRLNEQRIGSSQPLLTQRILNNIQVKIQFDPRRQQKIAAVLSALDAKIDCNNRINTELEAMAKTLYDYWFVQFDFPDANGKPYKSSGGKMVYNATLKREIPMGWHDGTIGNLISLEYGKGLKAENRTGSGYPVIGSNGVVGYHSDYLVEGPGIVVGRKGTVGAITFIHTNFFPIDTTYYVKPISKIGFLYLKYLLSSLGLEKMNSDSAVPGLNREAALRIATVLPPTTLIQELERRTATMFGKMHILAQENQQLAELRDWLLPLLMNGQVSISR